MHLERADALPAVATTAVTQLRRSLARLRLRLGLERLAVCAIRGTIASSLALIALSAGLWLTGADRTALWLAAAPLGAALAFGVWRWPSTQHAARAADDRLGLEERVATASELMRSGLGGRFDLLQVRDAARSLEAAPRTWLALNARLRNEAVAALVALAVAITAALILSRLSPPANPVAQSAGESTDAVVADQAVQPSLAADSAPGAVPLGADQARVATAPLPDLASRVQQEQAEQTALDTLARALSSVSASQPAADAIQQRDFSAARDQLQSLGEQADQLSAAAKQQLSRALQQAAAETTGADRALADRERQAAQALARPSYTEQRQALNALADQLQRSGARSVPADQLERELGQLEQQQSSASAGQASSSGSSASAASSAPASGSNQSGAGAGDQGQASSSAGNQSGQDTGQQGGPGVGTGPNPDPFASEPSRLDAAGQRVDVPAKLGSGPGVRPADGSEDQTGADASLGGESVSELVQAQQTGQVVPEQNLVPGEQRPVVRGYFR